MAIFALILSSCGGGGDSGSGGAGGSTQTAPSGLSYPVPPAFTVGTAITPLAPSVTGTPTSYSVSPALPTGLSISATTGIISGTPTTPRAATDYTITAGNAGGGTTAIVQITVNDLAPVIQYPRASYSFSLNHPVSGVTPSSGASAASNWSIDPALPPGLALDAVTGAITGTPTELSASATYIVTATSSGGTDIFELAIGVLSDAVIDLGHTNEITNLDHSGSRILSVDKLGQVVLWNSENGSVILRLTTGCEYACQRDAPVAYMAGTTVAARSLTALDFHDAADGASVAHVDAPIAEFPRFRFAADGSYAVLQGTAQLLVVSSTGSTLLSRPGDVSNSLVFAAPGEVRVARATATGGYTIETISLSDGTSSTTPVFTGSSGRWSDDGEHFIVTTPSGTSVYSQSGALLGGANDVSDTTYGSHGTWLWRVSLFEDELQVYEIGGSGFPVATYQIERLSDVVQSGNIVAFVAPTGNGRSISTLDLSGTSLSKSDYTMPVTRLTALVALSDSRWTFGTFDGVVMDAPNSSPGILYSYGRVHAMTADESRMAVATAGGPILVFETATRELERTIDFRSYRLHLSSDGTRLAAVSALENDALRVFSMPSGAVIAAWPAPTAPQVLAGFDFTEDARLALVSTREGTGNSATYDHRLLHIDSSAIVEEPLVNIGEPLVRLSPSGSRIAANNVVAPYSSPGVPSTTRIYTNGIYTVSVDGWSAGWIDESRLLVNRHEYGTGAPIYRDALLVDSAGQQLATLAIAEQVRIQPLGGDLFYSDQFNNRILNAATGEIVWSSPNSRIDLSLSGAANSDTVFFTLGPVIRAEPR